MGDGFHDRISCIWNLDSILYPVLTYTSLNWFSYILFDLKEDVEVKELFSLVFSYSICNQIYFYFLFHPSF
jgi:hypothetical protein